METTERRAVTFTDLADLTLRANVAFATRCAQRLRPCFRMAGPGRREQSLALDGALRVASAFCRGEPLEPGRAAAAVRAVLPIAEETCDETRFAGFAVLRAAEAVVEAEGFLATRDDVTLTEAIAAAFGAARVLAANAEPFSLGMVLAALILDVENLRRLAPGANHEVGAPLDISERGPLGSLWPEGIPPWYETAAG